MDRKTWLAQQPWYRRPVIRLDNGLDELEDRSFVWLKSHVGKDHWAWKVWNYLPANAVYVHKLICRVAGHSPQADHCGMAAHDHCEWCFTRTPGQAPFRRL